MAFRLVLGAAADLVALLLIEDALLSDRRFSGIVATAERRTGTSEEETKRKYRGVPIRSAKQMMDVDLTNYR